MKRAFVGVALRDELVTLLPERADVQAFLCRRAERMKAVCFWTVIDQSIANVIQSELDEGCSRNALILLQTLVVELGPVVPVAGSENTSDAVGYGHRVTSAA